MPAKKQALGEIENSDMRPISLSPLLFSAVLFMATFSMNSTLPAAAPGPTPTSADVPYGAHAHQILDIYAPADSKAPCPALIWFGGIWDASKHPVDLNRFNPKGIAVIAVETRTMKDAQADKASPPISYVLTDACRAVQFVRTNAGKWNLDPDRIAVGGGSQGALPALFVACAGERAKPDSTDPVERVPTNVTCVAAYRCQPSIDPKRMQEWVPGVVWGAPALGCSFEESLKRRDELLPIINTWSPDALLHKGVPPIYFENEWGLTQPENIQEMPYKVHSPGWAIGFQKLAQAAGVTCYVKYPDHPTPEYADIWNFVIEQLKRPAP
jgi:acetyl esterase/lipase